MFSLLKSSLQLVLTYSGALQNAERLDSEMIFSRDFDYDYFGFKVCSPASPCSNCMIHKIAHLYHLEPSCTEMIYLNRDALPAPWSALQLA